MDILLKARDYIYEHSLLDKKSYFVLALSGGADSMALAYFLKSEGYKFTAAHCNFQLRGNDAEADQQMVEKWCKEYNIKCYTRRFDTNQYARQNKISVEMAARNLRYEWFEELRVEIGASVIAVAHHMNDQIETFFLNMLRGTGIRGFKGMLARNGNVVRPFLQITRSEIEFYVEQNEIPYRTDETNTDTVFLRNAVRHNVVPELEKISPSFIETMSGNMQRLEGVWSFLEIYFQELEARLVSETLGVISIQLPDEMQSHIYLDFLNYLFSKNEYSFPLLEVSKIVDGQVGKFIDNHGYVLTKERGYLAVSQVVSMQGQSVEISAIPYKVNFGNYEFEFKYVSPQGEKAIPHSPDVVWLNASEKHLPLILRAWQPGDFMKPYGMNGRKKIKKMLTDAQVPSLQRKDYPVLCVNDEIIWLPLIRPNRDFKVTGNEEQVMEIRVTNKDNSKY